MGYQEQLSSFKTDLEADVKAIRTALSNKGVSATSTVLSGVASKINSITLTYSGTITVNYPTSWSGGYIYCQRSGGTKQSVATNGSGRATFNITQSGTYTITNSHQSQDSTTVTL